MSKHTQIQDKDIAENADSKLISKSQAKREATALQEIGKQLLHLSKKTLASFEIDERLLQEIYFAQTIKSNGAKRRHLQLIGKIMRQLDIEKIMVQLKQYQNKQMQKTVHFHHLEKWRDQLLLEGDAGINQLIGEYPRFDRKRLRTLLRNAKKEALQNKPPKSSRQIFQYLKELIES